MTVHALAVVLAGFAFTIYGYAIGKSFARPDGMPSKMRYLSVGGTCLALLHYLWLIQRPAGVGFLAVASAMQTLAIVLFVWAMRTMACHPLPIAFSASSPDRIVASGPWAFIRHPVYCCYTLTWFAGAVACRSALLAVTAIIMAAVYARMARDEERRLLSGPLREAYLDYMTIVGPFWPHIFWRGSRGRTHDWEPGG